MYTWAAVSSTTKPHKIIILWAQTEDACSSIEDSIRSVLILYFWTVKIDSTVWVCKRFISTMMYDHLHMWVFCISEYCWHWRSRAGGGYRDGPPILVRTCGICAKPLSYLEGVGSMIAWSKRIAYVNVSDELLLDKFFLVGAFCPTTSMPAPPSETLAAPLNVGWYRESICFSIITVQETALHPGMQGKLTVVYAVSWQQVLTVLDNV